MASTRLAGTLATVTAVAFALTTTTAPHPERRHDAAAASCASASFAVPRTSPFKLTPKPNLIGRPTALAGGNFATRAPGGRRCDCDLAIAAATGGSTDPDFLMLMQGNPDGSFVQVAAAPALEVAENPLALAAGPFKRDAGGLDSVVVVSGGATGPGMATIFVPDRNTGAYSKPATEPSTWQTGERPIAIATGDFNGDTNLDAAIANNRERTLTILLGNGSGSFAAEPVTVKGLPGMPQSITAGHFSGTTGASDIAVGIATDSPRRSAVVIVHGRTFAVDPPILVGGPGSAEPWVAAASLSSPASGNAPRLARDLVVGFTDFDAAQQPIAGITVLPGNGRGGAPNAAAARTMAIGDSRVRSIVVEDFDGDQVVDLAVSTFSDSDGEIRFFQGKAARDAIGFEKNPAWVDRPSTRPRSLVAGRFGPPAAGPSNRPHMGVAFRNEQAPEVGVFLGNGGGAFSQPEVMLTPRDLNAHLFVTGDFHSRNGRATLRDIAYMTKNSAGRRMLTVLRSNGAGGFTEKANPAAVAVPTLIGTGRFIGTEQDERPTDIAIVDVPTVGPPILKIFAGSGDGTSTFTLSSELLLGAGPPPDAMVTGRFRGANMPTDIALFRGDSLVLLKNDGQARFSVQPPLSLNGLRAGSVVASNRLRATGTLDILVRDATTGRFAFLVNIGNGDFRRAAENNGVTSGAGNVNVLLLGDVIPDEQHLDDVVTFDKDMTIRVFRNLAPDAEAFAAPVTSTIGSSRLTFAIDRYFLEDFGEGKPTLATAALLDGKAGLLVLRGNANGTFTAAREGSTDIDFTAFDTPALGGPGTKATDFRQRTSVPGVNSSISVSHGLSGRFRNDTTGNGRPDLVFMATLRTESFVAGPCPGDNRPAPFQSRIVCPSVADFDCQRIGRGKAEVCSVRAGVDCCLCPSVRFPFPPPGRMELACPDSCNTPPPIPFSPFCKTTRESAVVAVYGNSCTG